MAAADKQREDVRAQQKKEHASAVENERSLVALGNELIAKKIREALTENERQRDFYSQLGKPKLLYKCKESPFEKAIGAQIGTLNRLIADADRECGSSGYEILKSKE